MKVFAEIIFVVVANPHTCHCGLRPAISRIVDVFRGLRVGARNDKVRELSTPVSVGGSVVGLSVSRRPVAASDRRQSTKKRRSGAQCAPLPSYGILLKVGFVYSLWQPDCAVLTSNGDHRSPLRWDDGLLNFVISV